MNSLQKTPSLRHKSSDHYQYRCEVCGKKYALEQSFKYHMKRNHPEVCNEGGQPLKSLKSSNKINDSLLKTQHGSNNNTNNSGNKNPSSNNNNGLGNLDLSQFSLLSAEMKRELAGAGVQPSPLSEDKSKNNNLSNGAALAALLKQTTNTNNHHNHHPETPTQQQVQPTHHTESTKSQAEQLLEHLRATTTPSLANMNMENNLPNLLSKLSAGINKTNQTNQLINNSNSDKSSSNNNLIKNGRSEDSFNASPNLGDEPLAKRSKAESLLDLISGN